MLLSAGMDGPQWLPVWTMAKIIKDRAVEVEEARVEIFDLTHPAVNERSIDVESVWANRKPA